MIVISSATSSQASTIPAASCSRDAVAAAVAAANEGDTVRIPSCPAGVSWTSGLVVTKGITVEGQGPGFTVLLDDVPKGNSSCSGASPVIAFAVDAPQIFRLSALTIRGNAPDPFVCQPGHVGLSGTTKAFRVDHVQFVNQQTVAIRTSGALVGVIDHNTFSGTHKQGIIVDHSGWNGQSFGDGSWADATRLGSANFIFVEDNTFVDASPSAGAGAIDVFGGGRVVFRYNTAGHLSSHGTESTGRKRGMRAFEIYNNTFTSPAVAFFAPLYIRSGTGVVHSNTFVAVLPNTYNSIITVENDRTKDSFSPWRTCDGTSAYDDNDGIVYVSGTHTGAVITNILSDPTKSFTTACAGGSCAGQGFSIRNVTKAWGSSISGVSATTVTNAGSAFGQGRQWSPGDVYEIRKVRACIDQVGRGQGSMLSGATPSPANWPQQNPEPLYAWSNLTVGAVTNSINSASVHVVENRDFFNGTPKPGYSPFQYPHPLTLLSPPAPSTAPPAPKNLKVTPS